DLLFKPVSEGVFARWLALEDCLPAGDAWESQPGNLAGILEKNVRPSWRKARNPQIIATWDLQMNFEAAKATATQLTSAADRFNNLDRPKLLFGRARDRHQVGQPNRAIMEVMQLLREYPAHPETAEWSAFVRRALAAAPSSPEANDAGGRDTAKP
ncbi:MAG: hypothetical protein IAE97_13435, partial [Chthoniobacterales bacterium]|nr:hypothetical protein [Chthoniobacterales bacterium]